MADPPPDTTNHASYTTRLLAPDPDTIWGEDVTRDLVGKPVAFGIEGAHLPPGAEPKAIITRAWIDDEGWLCAEIDVDYGF